MSDKLYDIINKIQRWLPAFGTFYLTLASIWGFDNGIKVSKTILAVATLLAATLEIATSVYEKKQNGSIYGIVVPDCDPEEDD